jgi:hypothetical protein
MDTGAFGGAGRKINLQKLASSKGQGQTFQPADLKLRRVHD